MLIKGLNKLFCWLFDIRMMYVILFLSGIGSGTGSTSKGFLEYVEIHALC